MGTHTRVYSPSHSCVQPLRAINNLNACIQGDDSMVQRLRRPTSNLVIRGSILAHAEDFHNDNTAAAQVGFMLTYQHKCNIVAEITVSDFFFKKIK